MKMSINELKEIANDIEFKNAMQYYEGGYVEDLKIDFKDMTKFNAGKTMKINGRVISFDNFNSYDVEINWESVLNRITGFCSCRLIDKKSVQNGPCRHFTAVLIKYIYEYEKKYYSNIENNEIYSLIEKLKKASEDSSDYRREVELEIEFIKSDYFNKPYIEMKVGLDKKYVVKSMRNFLNSVSRKECIQFGKNFTYDPSIHKFNDMDEKIIELFTGICEIDNNNKSNGYGFRGYNYYSDSIVSGKKLYLTDMLAYRFFSLTKERSINADINAIKYPDVKTVEGKIPLEFSFNMKNKNIEFQHNTKIPQQIDNSGRVFFYEGTFYLPPEKQMKLYKPLYELFKSKKNSKLTIKNGEGEMAVSHLLPVLREVSDDIVMDKKIKDSFRQEPLIIKTYLDKSDDFITAAVKYIYGNIELEPFKEVKIEKNEKILIRDIQKEENCDKVLKSFGFEFENDRYVMKDEKNIVSFIDEGIKSMQKLSEVFYTDSFKNVKIYGKANIKSGIKLNNENLLEFTFELEGVDKSELRNIFLALKEKKKYYRLKKGGFVSLEDDGIKNVGDMIEYIGADEKELKDGKLLLSKYNALYLDQKINDGKMDYVEKDTDFKKLVSDIKNIEDVDFNIPGNLESVMRNYQKTGFKWFKTLAHFGFGGILADEMGLGKTLEAIAFMESEKTDMPCVVIAPSSLLYNWQSEIEKFAPSMKSIVIEGAKSIREEMLKTIADYDVVITSYPLIRRDIEEYEKLKFNYCIIDEAQQIKNAASLSANCVKKIKANGYFALTGTPIENSLAELWSIFDFLMPGYLLSHNKFTKIYELPIVKDDDKNVLSELNRHIKPFILRRLKKDVIRELPPKIEHKLVVDMTKEQKKLYAAYLNSAKEEIDEEIKINGYSKSKIKIFSILTRLRQICCDPSVFVENYKGSSGKMLALSELLSESIGHGHKILLFSQFTSVLKNIRKTLDENNTKYLYLDGSTKIHDRNCLVNQFNNEDYSVFLISLKAGGTGLNLTGADVVIHFDPWWNPAVEEQASDRAHRIGQEKTVEVIKLISKGTIEEKIFNLQEKKKKMIDSVINEDKNESNVITKMTQEELKDLFA